MARSCSDTNENTLPPTIPTPTNSLSITMASNDLPDTQKMFEDAEDEDEETILGSCQTGLSEPNFKRDNLEVVCRLWPFGSGDSTVIGSGNRKNEEQMNTNEGMGNENEDEKVSKIERLDEPRPLALIIDADMDTEQNGRTDLKDILEKKEKPWTRLRSPAIGGSLPINMFCRLYKQNKSTEDSSSSSESSPSSTKDVTSRPLQRYDPPIFHHRNTKDPAEPMDSAEGDDLQPLTSESQGRSWPTSFIELKPSVTDESGDSSISTFILPKDAKHLEIHIMTEPRGNFKDQTRHKIIIRLCGGSSSLQSKAVAGEVGIEQGMAAHQDSVSSEDRLLVYLDPANACLRIKLTENILMARPDVEYERGLDEGKQEQAENTKGLLLLLVVIFAFAGLDIWLSGAMLMVLVGIGKVIGFL